MIIGCYVYTTLIILANMCSELLPTWCWICMFLVLAGSIPYDMLKKIDMENRIADLETKVSKLQPYFTPEDVRRMTEKEVRQNHTAIIKSMEKWK